MKQHENTESAIFLGRKSIPFDPKSIAVELKQLVGRYIAENPKLEIICLAEAAEHYVVFISPYYSSL